MEKIWYIKVNGKPEGPFSILDLKRDWRITPDTLVWREGFEKWVPIRNVVELREVFKDEGDDLNDEKEKIRFPKTANKDEIALDMRSDPPNFSWALIFLLILIYFLTQMIWFR